MFHLIRFRVCVLLVSILLEDLFLTKYLCSRGGMYDPCIVKLYLAEFKLPVFLNAL